MDEKLCEANRKPILDKINSLSSIVDKLVSDVSDMKLDIAGQTKDTLHLQAAIVTLQMSIDKLIDVIDGMKYKPIKNYEKLIWIFVTGIAMFILGRLGIK